MIYIFCKKVGWNQNVCILSPPTPLEEVRSPPHRSLRPILLVQIGPDVPRDVTDMKRYSLLSRMSSIISSEQTLTPFFINEENTSVFLNAVTGMFFPCCHTHLQPLGPEMAHSDPETYRLFLPTSVLLTRINVGRETRRGWRVF